MKDLTAKRRRISARIVLLLLLLCCALLSVSCAGSGTLPEGIALRMYFLDVGQGDCALLQTEEGYILIDGGSEESQETLCLRLADLGVDRFRLAIFSHGDEDHTGGADGILSRFPAEEIWIARTFDPSGESAENLIAAANDCGATIRTVGAGATRTIGGVHLRVLFPASGDGRLTENTSLVVKVSCGKVSALFTGDCTEAEEEALLASDEAFLLPSALLKVGHHGSSTSTSPAFAEAVRPTFAVISCAAGNPYGHPHGATLETLDRVGAEILRTDLSGEIVLETNGETLTRVLP